MERESFIAEAYGADDGMRSEVEKMLIFDDDDILEKTAFDFWANDEFSAVPKKIGHYKIIREIGRDGMGAVYLAERDGGEFSQRVAIKLIKREMDSEETLRRLKNMKKRLMKRSKFGKLTAVIPKVSICCETFTKN